MGKYGKLIRIQLCSECPKFKIKWNEEKQGYTDHVCFLLREDKNGKFIDFILTNLHKIPKKCPLEDYP